MLKHLILMLVLMVCSFLSVIICSAFQSDFSFLCWLLGGISYIIYDAVHVKLNKDHVIVVKKNS